MTSNLWPWIIFTIVVLGILLADLGVLHRRAHAVSKKEATLWALACVLLAAIFNVGLYFTHGPERALEFLTGYLIEESLSIDNLFVFLVIFSYFGVPPAYQHRVLFWGIIGALLMRGFFIVLGAVLLERFHWTIYVFGAFLVFTGFKMLAQEEAEIHPEDNPAIRLLRRIMPISRNYEGQRFFIKHQGRWVATPLFVVLLAVEGTDLIFAVDSIPAILAITTDPFIVYTSNVFAILGLRALYFVLASVLDLFHYLRYGLGCVLAFVGVKMLLADTYEIPIGVSLGVTAGLLGLSVAASLLFPRRQGDAEPRVTRNFLRKWNARAYKQLPGRRGVTATGFAAAAVGVAIVTTVSIGGAPSVQHAALIVHRAQQEMIEAREVFPNDKSSVLHGAETSLSLAQTALAERRYEDAITAAIRAREAVSTQVAIELAPRIPEQAGTTSTKFASEASFSSPAHDVHAAPLKGSYGLGVAPSGKE